MSETATKKEIKLAYNNLNEALAAFRKEIGGKVKAKDDNPFFKSKYADLATIKEVIDPILEKLGLEVRSSSRFSISKGWYVRTKVLHVGTGEYEISDFPLIGAKPQEQGSSFTYGRRYNVQALLDIVADKDDDGNEAQKAKPIAPTTSGTNGGFVNSNARKSHWVKTKEQINALKTSRDWQINQNAIEQAIGEQRKADAQSADNLQRLLDDKLNAIDPLGGDDVPF